MNIVLGDTAIPKHPKNHKLPAPPPPPPPGAAQSARDFAYAPNKVTPNVRRTFVTHHILSLELNDFNFNIEFPKRPHRKR